MTDETNTLEQGGGEASPAETITPVKPVPKSDAEAALLEKAEPATTEAAKKEAEEAAKKKNRTRDYIERLQTRNREMETRLAEVEKRLPKTEAVVEKEPTAEDYGWDQEKYAKALIEYNLKQERAKWEQEATEKAQRESAEKEYQSYTQRVAKFAESHPDFEEVIASMQYELAPQAQVAIVRHEKGAEIAYFLATNDDEAFMLANVQPQYAALAIERLAARMGLAQQPPGKSDADTGAETAPTPKPVTKAPTPPPSVSGRSVTETPPEKMTDDQWYAQEKERSRKR